MESTAHGLYYTIDLSQYRNAATHSEVINDVMVNLPSTETFTSALSLPTSHEIKPLFCRSAVILRPNEDPVVHGNDPSNSGSTEPTQGMRRVSPSDVAREEGGGRMSRSSTEAVPA